MTDQITVPRATWDALREALEVLNNLDADINFLNTNELEDMMDKALTAANAVQRPTDRDIAGENQQSTNEQFAVNAVSVEPEPPSDENISDAWISASDSDGIAYDGPSFERGYRLGRGEYDEYTGALVAAAKAESLTAANAVTSECSKVTSEYSELATIAGLEASIGHLSALVNEQLLLLEEVNDNLGVDGLGVKLDDDQSPTIAKVRAHLAAMAPAVQPQSQGEAARLKAFLHKHKSSALPEGACITCEGEGEIGGQFCGGYQICPDCAGAGKTPSNPQATEPAWRPIESAPKDGTVFLGLHGYKVREAYRVQRDDCEMWCFGGHSGDVEIAPWTKPTHWIPLPAQPEEP